MHLIIALLISITGTFTGLELHRRYLKRRRLRSSSLDPSSRPRKPWYRREFKDYGPVGKTVVLTFYASIGVVPFLSASTRRKAIAIVFLILVYVGLQVIASAWEKRAEFGTTPQFRWVLYIYTLLLVSLGVGGYFVGGLRLLVFSMVGALIMVIAGRKTRTQRN